MASIQHDPARRIRRIRRIAARLNTVDGTMLFPSKLDELRGITAKRVARHFARHQLVAVGLLTELAWLCDYAGEQSQELERLSPHGECESCCYNDTPCNLHPCRKCLTDYRMIGERTEWAR